MCDGNEKARYIQNLVSTLIWEGVDDKRVRTAVHVERVTTTVHNKRAEQQSLKMGARTAVCNEALRTAVHKRVRTAVHDDRDRKTVHNERVRIVIHMTCE